MRSLTIFETPEAHIEELKADLRAIEERLQTLRAGRGGVRLAGVRVESLEDLKEERVVLDLKIQRETLKRAILALENLARAKGSGQRMETVRASSLELEAIINAKYRPALVFDGEHQLRPTDVSKLGLMEDGKHSWAKLIAAALAAKNPAGQTLVDSAKLVARVEHSSGAVVGTGWVTGQGRLLTNRHVVRGVSSGWFYPDSAGKWIPIDGNRGVLNYDASWNAKGGRMNEFDVLSVALEPGPDAAVLASEEASSHLGVVYDAAELSQGGKLEDALRGRLVAVIGHPSAQGENPADEFQSVFGAAPLRLKRFMPGKLQTKPLGEFAGLPLLMHDCSTLQGASGSCVVDLGPVGTDFTKPECLPKTFGKVIGLHFAGIWSESNFAIPTWELAKRNII